MLSCLCAVLQSFWSLVSDALGSILDNTSRDSGGGEQTQGETDMETGQ